MMRWDRRFNTLMNGSRFPSGVTAPLPHDTVDLHVGEQPTVFQRIETKRVKKKSQKQQVRTVDLWETAS